jgi:hypothetical protein
LETAFVRTVPLSGQKENNMTAMKTMRSAPTITRPGLAVSVLRIRRIFGALFLMANLFRRNSSEDVRFQTESHPEGAGCEAFGGLHQSHVAVACFARIQDEAGERERPVLPDASLHVAVALQIARRTLAPASTNEFSADAGSRVWYGELNTQLLCQGSQTPQLE